MDIKEKVSKDLNKEFEIKIKRETIDQSVDKKLEEVSSKANLPGFRPGKVPLSILRARFGKQVLGEVINDSIDESSKKIIEDYKINAVSQPKIEITSFEEGKDLIAKFSVELMPEFKVPDLANFKITRPVAKVSDDDVDETITKIANENAQSEVLTENRPVKDNDIVVIDFQGSIDGKVFEGGDAKNYHLKIGSNSFIPGFEKKLIGSKVGEEKKLDLSFPKDYQAVELADKKAVFTVKINEIRVEKPVVIDDNFAKSLGLDDLNVLKIKVREQITNQHSYASRLKAKRDILDKLADAVVFNAPITLEQQEYISVCKATNINNKKEQTDASKNDHEEPDKGMSKEEKEDARAIASRRVRLGLVLSEIGRLNNIKVDEEDTQKAVMNEAQKYPGKEKEVLEHFKNNQEARNQLTGPIFEDKIIDFILELASVTEIQVSTEELYKEEDVDLKNEANKAKKSLKKPLTKKNNIKKKVNKK